MKKNAETQAKSPTGVEASERWFRNPLVVFGLALVGGEGPLLSAYLAPGPSVLKGLSLLGLIIFTLMMGVFFFYIVGWKPRHLYEPSSIPTGAYGKSIYDDAHLLKMADEAETSAIEGLRDNITKIRGATSSKSSGSVNDGLDKIAAIVDDLKTIREGKANITKKTPETSSSGGREKPLDSCLEGHILRTISKYYQNKS